MKRRLLSWLRISELPDPPPGAGESLTTFRASKRYLYLKILQWIPRQISTLVGIVVAFVFFGKIEEKIVQSEQGQQIQETMKEMMSYDFNPLAVFMFFEWFAVAIFIVQMVVTGCLIKVSWELRWYMVGDESLRIREGLWTLREQTVTIANIQNMTVRQGPLQKLFGIADLDVETAGGGGPPKPGNTGEGFRPLHVARFSGVEDAQGLRDRIRSQLILHRGAGLGDEGEERVDTSAKACSGSAAPGELAQAAQELLEETRALRCAMSPSLNGGSRQQSGTLA